MNPAHLFLGTALDNARDMVRKCRHRRGEERSDKLTDIQVREIRRLRSEGQYFKVIAGQFSVSAACVRNIIVGKTWRHVT